MSIHPLIVGESNVNLAQLMQGPLTTETVLTREVLDLLKQNDRLRSSCFERFRAKTFSVIVGAVLPLFIVAALGLVLYQTYQYGILVPALQWLASAITQLAQQIFSAITASNTILVASAGGVFTLGYIFTRPAVTSAIGSCVGSLCGTCAGTGLLGLFKAVVTSGYNWSYNSYHFTERDACIASNQVKIVSVLTDVYNDIAEVLKKSCDRQLIELRDHRFPKIQGIMRSAGILQVEEITLQFQKAIGSTFDISFSSI